MPLTFPLSVADFQNTFRTVVTQFRLFTPMQIDRTANGTVLPASLGDAVWRGSFTLTPQRSESAAARLDALLSVLDRPGSSVLLFDPRKQFPAADPSGATLGSSTPVVSALDSGDARLLSVSGLPANYVLTAGDLIGWTYGSSPTRYALHRIVSDVTANGSGATALFEVSPFIQPGVTVSTAVTLIRPPIKALLDGAPGYGARRPGLFDGASFSFVQTLR